MKFDVLTLFPEMIDNYCSCSIIKRAQETGVVSINTVNPRDYAENKHRKVDDIPYGGGAGMVLMPQPVFSALDKVPKEKKYSIVMMTPQGKTFNHKIAQELSQKDQLIMICGHYEGFDERIREGIVNLVELSIGDFVMTGGEPAAICMIDAITRLLPNALGKEESATEDTFYNGLIEYPHYTRPSEYLGMEVPEVLRSGNHKNIEIWRQKQSLIRTYNRRPDLFDKYIQDFKQQEHSKQEKLIIKEVLEEIKGINNIKSSQT